MFGNVDLRGIKNALEVTNAQGTAGQKMENAQAREIAQALVNLDGFHGRQYNLTGIYCKRYIS